MTNSKGAQNAVVIERSFDAPVELIWQMWTDPAHFAAWYGPDGASIPVAKMDVRAGGTRLVCMEMQTPGGPMHMWFTGEYRDPRRPRGPGRPHEDGHDPRRRSRGLPRSRWLGDGDRQARYPVPDAR